VLDGQLEVSSGSDTRQAWRGSLLHFDPGERHEVRAKTDTRILLLLAPWPGVGHPSAVARPARDGERHSPSGELAHLKTIRTKIVRTIVAEL